MPLSVYLLALSTESVIRNASCDVLVVRTDLDNKLSKNEEK